ncbi:extracellular solute-binding protein [Kineococcus sp. NBC_00420]|uniref:ABC transporter substrate-binding protein n=1 Tax=Kineococcus sp. NBC_00420 TaxID=2903564 RepID=UPI002E1BDC3E
MNPTRRAAAAMFAGTFLTGLALSACSSGTDDTEPVSSDDVRKALDTDTQLTFWTWVPDIQKEVDLFQRKYPKIKVKVENVGQGLAHYQKVRTAVKSKDGAPDVVQIEYQYLSSFEVNDSLLDLGPLGAGDLSADYVDWVWKQVSTGDSVWAIPQDTGPMGNLYRNDLLQKAGVETPPVTWADYAAAAEKVRSTGSYISNFANNDFGPFIGLLWQAGVKPFAYDGDKGVSISVNSTGAKKVIAYWQDLIQRDLVSVDADFNDAYYQALNSGKYAGWLTAAWAPVFLQGTVESTTGLWRAAPLPQWSAGQNVSGNWGGSSNAVLSTTQNRIAAYELAKWINHDPASTTKLALEQSLFPAAEGVLKDPTFTDQSVDFFGGQKVNELFAEISGTVDTEFAWLPFTDYAASQYTEVVGKAIGAKGDLSAALDDWQGVLEKYAKDQGFTVTGR